MLYVVIHYVGADRDVHSLFPVPEHINTMERATAWLTQSLCEGGSDTLPDATSVDGAWVFDVAEASTLDMKWIEAETIRLKQVEDKRAHEERDRREWERLKAKFGE